ncbi:hypothetical protein JNUCC83_05395 [Vagococcus sp. JNUCC 83]
MAKLFEIANRIQKLVNEHDEPIFCQKDNCPICQEIDVLRLQLGIPIKKREKKDKPPQRDKSIYGKKKPTYVFSAEKDGNTEIFYKTDSLAKYVGCSPPTASRRAADGIKVNGYKITKTAFENGS